MKQSLCTALLVAAALLMMFGAFGDALVVVPDLHGDLLAIGVLLGAALVVPASTRSLT